MSDFFSNFASASLASFPRGGHPFYSGAKRRNDAGKTHERVSAFFVDGPLALISLYAC